MTDGRVKGRLIGSGLACMMDLTACNCDPIVVAMLWQKKGRRVERGEKMTIVEGASYRARRCERRKKMAIVKESIS